MKHLPMAIKSFFRKNFRGVYPFRPNSNFLLVLVVCLLSPPSLKAQWQDIPAGGTSLLPDLPAGDLFSLKGSEKNTATSEVRTVSGMPFTNSFAATTTQVGTNAWAVMIGANTTGAIAAGDVLLLAFFARGESTLEGGEVTAKAHLQRNSAPSTKIITSPIDSGADWRQFLVPVEAAEAFADGEHNFRVHIAAEIQTVEIGGLEIINYQDTKTVEELPKTHITYDGSASNAPWRALAQQRIEQHRKGNLDLTVLDGNGLPVSNVQVRVQMKRHAFGFGNNLHGNVIGPTEEEYNAIPESSRVGDSYQDLLNYRQWFEQYFNKAVTGNDLKWGGWVQGASNTHNSYRREWVDRTLQWTADRGIETRGHWVSYGPVDSNKLFSLGFPDTPDPLENLDQRILAHIDDKVPTVGDRVGEWDVINHIVGWGTNTLETIYGTEFYEQIIARTRLQNPNAELWVNEGQILPSGSRVSAYTNVIQHLIDAGYAPDGIGFMGHFSLGTLTGMDTLYQRFETFAALIPNLQITEFDINVMPGYEQLQADYFRDFMTLAFSHPAMQGIVQWGFWEGRHWRPDAALWRTDWSIKPVGQAYLDLVFDEWWTDETLTTDAGGNISTRGFLGEYEITVTEDGIDQTFNLTLTSGGISNTLAFTAPQQAISKFTDMNWSDAASAWEFEISGLAGQTYVLEASSNLTTSSSWQVIDTTTFSSNTWSVSDPDAHLYPLRFYRSRRIP